MPVSPVSPTRKVLTDKFLQSIKPAPAGKRVVVYDALQPHFGVRITDRAIVGGPDDGKAAVVSFIVYKRPAGSKVPVVVTIGRYPAVKLADARDRTTDILRTLDQGRLPAEVEAERRREDARRRADTFATAVGEFVEHERGRGLRSWRETEAILRREFLGQTAKRVRKTVERSGKSSVELITEWTDGPEPAWRNRPVAEIVRRDVIERLDAIKARAGKHAARHALGAVRKLFSWAEEGERYGITESPAARVRDKTLGITGRDLKRSRVLDDAELHDAWGAAEEMAFPFGRVVQLLMLTGQRLNDVARAQRPEIAADTLTVPATRYKTGVAQEVPLSPRATKIVAGLPKFAGPFLFTTTGGKRPISGLSKMKARLDQKIATKREAEGREKMAAWTLHDLRRTVRTRLVSDCNVDAFTAERVLGHALPGLHGVYDQGTHREQKRAALEKWEARLLAIVEPKEPKKSRRGRMPKNVVRLDARRRA